MSDTRKGKKGKKIVTSGVAHILATFNNTIINITDTLGNTLVWSTSGTAGFKGSRKSTPFAAQVAAERATQRAISMFNMKEVKLCIRGTGSGRESAMRSIHASGLSVIEMKDVTPIAHNGCRPPKRRRI